MRMHLQGVALLLFLAAALWGTAKLASPAMDRALSDDGAVVTESTPADEVDLSSSVADEPEPEMTFEEVSTLQWLLAIEGFLDVETDIDGALGPLTRNAIQDAKTAYAIPAASDRRLLEVLGERNANLFGPTDPGAGE